MLHQQFGSDKIGRINSGNINSLQISSYQTAQSQKRSGGIPEDYVNPLAFQTKDESAGTGSEVLEERE